MFKKEFITVTLASALIVFLTAGLAFYIGNAQTPRNTAIKAEALVSLTPEPTPEATHHPIIIVESKPTMTATPSPIPSAKPEVVNRDIRLGVVVDDYANRTGQISNIESMLGTNISTISVFKHFEGPHRDIVLSDLNYIVSSQKTLMLSWEPWDPSRGLNQEKDYLYEITSGNQDGYIESFANQVRQINTRVIIRFGHEMNGNWYPWGNRPGEYIMAYRYVHDKFESLGVNVEWIWSPNHESVPWQPASYLDQFYPGDQYVDYIGIDGFNFGPTQSYLSWRSFDEIFQDSYFHLNNYGKPIIIAEMASTEVGGDKAAWVNDMFDKLSSKYTNIREIIWFNLNKETDWRFNSSTSSLEAFKNGL